MEPVENTCTKTLRNLCFQTAFSDGETLVLSTDPCKITGIAKLYYNAHIISPVIVRFCLNVFSCRFSTCLYNGIQTKNNKILTFLMLVILKNHEHINELQGAVSVQGQTNTNS